MNRVALNRSKSQLQTKSSEIEFKFDKQRKTESASSKAERDLNLGSFKQLLGLFQVHVDNKKYANPTTGNLGLESFKSAFASIYGRELTDEQLTLLFMKIDVDNDNEINWDDFSSYMLLRAEGQRQLSEEADIQLYETAKIADSKRYNIHKEMIVRVQYLPGTKRIMACCREGTVSFWNDQLKLQRKFINAGQVHSEDRKRNVTNFIGTEYRWVHDAYYIESIQKLVMASDDHQISFYESSTLERTMCFDLQNVNALSIDYYRGPNPSKSTLYFSTDSGHINTFIFDEDQLAKNCAQQNGSVEFHLIEKEGTTKLQNIGCISKRKTHNDWALKVRHFPELRSVISCSADEVNSLVIAETDINQKIQLHSVSIPRGVQTFAVSKAPLFIITGGRDRLLRLWNPHRLETPTSSLEGHLAPIVDITINEASNQILSLSSDKVVKVWDSRKQCCLQTISRNSREMPDDRLSNVLFIPDFGGSILTTSNSIYQYRLHQKLETTIHPQSHQDPVRCLASNSVFNQVISGCDGGVINVWDENTGQKLFKFCASSNGSEITALTIDAQGRRVITGTRDGKVQIWNINNGELLQTAYVNTDSEITKILYIPLKGLAYILVTGWDKKVSVFLDNPSSISLIPEYELPSKQQSSNLLWHTDDILSMTFCAPDSVASSSYGGRIVLCSLQSGLMTHSFSPHSKTSEDISIQHKSIDQLLFLPKRARVSPKSASLISAGGDGFVRFWNSHTAQLYFEMDCRMGRRDGIYSIHTNQDNELLFVSDSAGWISVYNIKEAGMCKVLDSTYHLDKMPLLLTFQAHNTPVTGLEYLEGSKMILSSSVDGSIRMFTAEGFFVGIFGQSHAWNTGDPTTFAHPFQPWDISSSGPKSQMTKYADRLKGKKKKTSEPSLLSVVNHARSALRNSTPKRQSSANKVLEGTWFSNSFYAKNRFLQKQGRKNQSIAVKVAYNASGGLRVFTQLEPQELQQVSTTEYIRENKSTTIAKASTTTDRLK